MDLEFLFHPRSIAVVGASADPAKAGYEYLRAVLDTGFRGEVYPVNTKRSEVLGLKCYPAIGDISGPVDYVISCIPAQYNLGLVRECAEKGARTLHIYSSGFRETGEEEGARLEAELEQLVRRSGVRVIGPNCMGIHYPQGGLALFKGSSPGEKGTLGFLSQSGGNASRLLRMGQARGLRFSKVISYGNACDLNESDFLEYLGDDPETEVIAAYIEGIKEGPRFLSTLKRASRLKPVIALKGGLTEAGTRAVASHTGLLAGEGAIWEAACRQTGVVQVSSVEEMADVALAFLYLPVPTGWGVGVIGEGGGGSVHAADQCEGAGLSVPTLPAAVQHKLREFTPPVGSSIRNPVDTPAAWNISPEELAQTIELVAACPEIDLLIVHMDLDDIYNWGGRGELDRALGAVLVAGKAIAKPLAIVLHHAPASQGLLILRELEEHCQEAGFPLYPTLGQAANALGKFAKYQEGYRE